MAHSTEKFWILGDWVPGIKRARRTQISSCFIFGYVLTRPVSRPHALRESTGWILVTSPLPPLEPGSRGVSKAMPRSDFFWGGDARTLARDGNHDRKKDLQKSPQAKQESPKCVLAWVLSSNRVAEKCKLIGPAR